jgi:hypothetical protein
MACFVAGEGTKTGPQKTPAGTTPSGAEKTSHDGTLAPGPYQDAPKKARDLYRKGVQALLQGHAEEAEDDALRAVRAGAGFADAYSLAAAAELSQQKFVQAQASANAALQEDGSSLRAHVLLATADNYLGQYAKARAALAPVLAASDQWWQVAYQMARAEVGLENAQAALDWSNRAVLLAPTDFAPLHLLHASALLACAQYARAADELETYLQLAGATAPEQAALQRDLKQLRKLANEGPQP